MAVEGNVENDSPAPAGSQPVRSTPPVSHVIMRRKPSSGRARPTSQPPPAHVIVTGATVGALASRGSDESLTDGTQPSSILHSN